MKCNYYTVADNVHFSIVKKSASCCGLKIVVDCKRKISNLIKVSLIVHYRIVKFLRIARLASTTPDVFWHGFLRFSKKILAIRTLLNCMRLNCSFFTILIKCYICHVNFWFKETVNWSLRVFWWLVDNVKQDKIFFS